MADIHHVITLGIGTPADIPHFILVGLSPLGVIHVVSTAAITSTSEGDLRSTSDGAIRDTSPGSERTTS